MPATTVIISIGSRTSDSVTVSTGGVTTTTVSGFSNAWNVVLSATVPSTTKIGDKLTTGANNYLISGISGSTLTVVGDASASLTSTSTPSTGSATTSRAYATITAWASGAPSSLLTPDSNNGWVWKGEVYKEGAGTNGEWTSTAAADLRKSCDSTRYFWLTAASGQSFRDNASKLTTALRYNAANGVAISFTGGITLFILTQSVTGRLEVDGLQFKGPTATGTWLVNATLGTAKISNCIIENAPVRGYTTLINVLAFQNKTEQFWLSPDSVSGISFINCTIVGNNATQAFNTRTNDSNIAVRNCAVFNVTAVAANNASISTANSTYNATNLASFGWTGTGNIVNNTYANQFESVGSGTEDFRVKTGANLINAGIRDQTFTNDVDIVGSARGTGAVGTSTAPTIGAWEYSAIVTTTIYEFNSFNRGVGRGIARGIA
jgi:hypothetical protein